MHKSQDYLSNRLKLAEKQVEVGKMYFHYKNPEQAYKVIKIAITEWDDEICVIYEARYGNNLAFVRPLNSWLSKVKHEGRIQSRFTLIET
jgi:hypothetical protein